MSIVFVVNSNRNLICFQSMLTQKQIFRKSALNLSNNIPKGTAYNNNGDGKTLVDKQDDDTTSITQTDSQSVYSSESDQLCNSRVGTALYDKNYRTTADHIPLGLEKNMPTPRKNVRFSNTVRVCLIPCRRELEVIKNRLWWSPYDVEFFKMDAYEEMKHYIELHKCSVKDGLTNLYQPSKQELEYK